MILFVPEYLGLEEFGHVLIQIGERQRCRDVEGTIETVNRVAVVFLPRFLHSYCLSVLERHETYLFFNFPIDFPKSINFASSANIILQSVRFTPRCLTV